METKTYKAKLQFKSDGKPGEFEAVFATMGVIDLDGDVTVNGAFGEQKVIIEPWNHNTESPPVGKGIITERGDEAIVKGYFFLNTPSGDEHYKVAKELGDMQEWSYTFNIRDAAPGRVNNREIRFLKEMEVVGVGQVSKGAGINTRTTDIKERKSAIRSHSTDTSDAAWNGPANEARLRTDENAAYYRRAYAWVDPDGDPATKTAYRFIHHEVNGDGNIGAANIRACQTGIGVLNGARGGTTIPESDRQGVYNHLARHLRDADVEPPELKSLSEIEDEAGKGKSSNTDLMTKIDLLELSVIKNKLET